MNEESHISQIDDIFTNLKKSQKKKINSKRKGNTSELKICKILSDRFGQKFNRVPNSGAYGSTHTLSEQMTVSLAGDIITPENFYFVIENKAGYKIEIFNIFKKENSSHKKIIYSFLDQASKDAKRANRIPLIIYTKDRCQTVCILPIDNNEKGNYMIDKIEEENITHLRFMYKTNIKQWSKWVILSLDDFLSFSDDFYYE